jgi:transcriptional regulator with XRE-family HTH domain
MVTDIGQKIKELRNNKGLTLKDLSEGTNLSIGFLSQLERGLTSISIDALEAIAKVFEVESAYFFSLPTNKKRCVMRSHEREIFNIEGGKFIHYHLSSNLEDKIMLPRLVEILPNNSSEEIELYNHQGEEIVYILEGILTVLFNNEVYELYPGDCLHIKSTNNHNWVNNTNKMVKLISVHTPTSL